MAQFSQRRAELTVALSVRNANAINRVGDAVAASGAVLHQGVEMLHLLRQVQSPQERQLMQFVNEHGGASSFLADEGVGAFVYSARPDSDCFQAFSALQERAIELGGVKQQPATEEMQHALLQSIRDTMRTDIGQLLKEHHDEFSRNFERLDATLQREADAPHSTVAHSAVRHRVWRARDDRTQPPANHCRRARWDPQ